MTRGFVRPFPRALLGLALSSGCYSGLGGHTAGAGDDDSASGGENGTADDEGGSDDGVPADPDRIAPIGLRRLTADEYDNTLRDLLLDDTRASQLVLPEDLRTPFDNDYTLQEPSLALIEGADLLAADAASRLIADPAKRDAVVGCVPSGPADEACFSSFVTSFGRRAFRRPLDDDELAAFMAFHAQSIEHDDFYTGVDSVVRAVLQAPSFLYRVEIGTPVADDPALRKLTGYEIATRLSYLLWGSMPSDELLDAAEGGELDSAAGTRTAAEQMLLDPRALDRIGRFHALWMGYETLPHDYELVAAMQAETRALMQRIVIDERRPWQDLLRLDETWIDALLAEHYGLPAPAGDGPAWVPYGDSGRKGLLSHGSFLSLGAKFGDTSPTQRGLLVQTRLFCQDIPPPPPDPDINVDEPPGDPESQCKIDRYAAHRAAGTSCKGCHDLVDPIGLGLENYDAQGRWRDHDDGKPECIIAGEGAITGIGDFSGPSELADLMIESGRLNQCVATQVYRFTIGRYALGSVDEEILLELVEKMGSGDFMFDELLVNIVESDMFRFRRQEEV
ncbi:MAG TPA: DUF1592 domain-containing protein [Nannocystaceae bacterium]|nr:DUF1592 domain-containing protein [Nannocystaceae bacterium]